MKEEALDRLRRAVAGDRAAVRKLYAGEVDASAIFDAQQNVSLFEPVGAVVVRDAGRLQAAVCESLLAVLEAPEGGPPVVFWDESVDRRRKLFQEIARRGGEREFAAPRASEARERVPEEARRLGRKIEPAAAALLVDLVGTDILRLRSTLEMLSLAVAEGATIDRQTVVEMVPEARAHALYELQDEMTSRRAAGAVRLLRDALDHGEGPEVVLGALAAQLRRLLFARALRDGAPSPDRKDRLVRETGTPPFKADAILTASTRFSPQELRRALERLADVDVALKRGRADAGAALESWLLAFCSQNG